MKSTLRFVTILFAPIAALVVQTLFICNANAADAQRTPMTVLTALADRIYVVGETSGKVEAMIDAEAKASDEVRRYIASGLTDGLLAKEKGKQSPLMAAAYMGYPNVVAALLTSDLVRAHINDADEMGMTPWIAANFSMRQSLWTCNPTVFDDPFRFVQMFVTQPYYITNPTPPYKRAREVLEEAGASSDMAKAKIVWLTACKSESDEAKTKVQASTDLQKTVQELGAADLVSQLTKLQQKAARGAKVPDAAVESPLLDKAAQQKKYFAPPSDYVPLDRIKIKSRFDTVSLTKENLAAEQKKCIPYIESNTESMNAAVREFPRDNTIVAVGHKNSSKRFVYRGSTGLCLEFSANRYPIFAAETLVGTANPKGIPPNVTDDWYMKIAAKIAIDGRAKVTYVTDKGTAFIVSYWSEQAGGVALHYRTEFKKAGEWEDTEVDYRFSHPALNALSETKRGDSKQLVKNFPLATEQ